MREAGSRPKCGSLPLVSASPQNNPDSQTAEIQIRGALINRFNAFGTAEIVRVA